MKRINSLLIANRGEIALRILRTCKEMGIRTVAPYARVDKQLLHLRYADDIVCISNTDYLCRENLVSAAKMTDCDAIHPGYGFLAEDARFCEMTEDNGLIFVGPAHEQIASMGNKVSARAKLNGLGLQAVPGSTADVEDPVDALRIANQVGFPVVVKAAFGGGGRGIRLIEDEAAFEMGFAEARAEAEAVFGDGTVYIEKFLGSARHVEVQVLGDGQGNAIHLGTRECSIQRRHQKVIEEAPAPHIPTSMLDRLCELSVRAVSAMGYRNAGTLEFLYQDGEFYFMEMNTRIQVEHPVTEAITGVDLVRLQLEVADSGVLPLGQNDVSFRGCAMECRVNAEDDKHQPSPGTVSGVSLPAGPGVRVDTHLYPGYTIPHHFDSLIAKLVAMDTDRSATLNKMQRMLAELKIDGIDTNKDNLLRVVTDGGYRRGEINTRYLDKLLGDV